MPEPCSACPFLRDGDGRTPVRLMPDRIVEIVASVAPTNGQGGGFPCHKTVDYDGRDVSTEKQCAGALIFAYKLGVSTQLTRVMERIGAIDPALAEGEHPEVFDSVDEMLATAIQRRPKNRRRRS